MTSNESAPEFDLFFSYNHKSATQVENLYDRIKSQYSASIWIDYEQLLGNGSLASLLIQGLKASKFVVCFVSKEYSKSANCRRELSMVYYLKKPHAILMLDHFDEVDEAVQFQIGDESRLNFYANKNEVGRSIWSGRVYEQFVKTIRPYVTALANETTVDDRPMGGGSIAEVMAAIPRFVLNWFAPSAGAVTNITTANTVWHPQSCTPDAIELRAKNISDIKRYRRKKRAYLRSRFEQEQSIFEVQWDQEMKQLEESRGLNGIGSLE